MWMIFFWSAIVCLGSQALSRSWAWNMKWKTSELSNVTWALNSQGISTVCTCIKESTSQSISNLLEEQQLLDCKVASTSHCRKVLPQPPLLTPTIDRTNYYQIVGKLLYLTNTHPDLSYVVGDSCPCYVNLAPTTFRYCEAYPLLPQGDNESRAFLQVWGPHYTWRLHRLHFLDCP